MSDIQIFERVDVATANLTSPELAVKRFARTVDDPHPSEFRTRAALTLTMDYLRRLLDRTGERFRLPLWVCDTLLAAGSELNIKSALTLT